MYTYLFTSKTTHHAWTDANTIWIDRRTFIFHFFNHLDLNWLPKLLRIFIHLLMLLLLSHFLFFNFFYMIFEFKTHFLENTFMKFLIQLVKSLLFFLTLDFNRCYRLALSWSIFFFSRGSHFLNRTAILIEFNFLICYFTEIKMPIFDIKRRLRNVLFYNRCLVFWD